MLERKNLAAIPQRALCEQAKLGQAVKDDACGSEGLDLIENHLSGFAQLHLRGLQHGELLAWIQASFWRNELKDRDALEGPPVTLGYEP